MLARSIRPLRPDVPDEVHFVTKGWASEMRSSAWARHVPNEVYWPSQHELAHRLMSGAQVLIACNPKDEDTLYGCIVHLPGPLAIVHWLYTKGPVRRDGIARALLEAAIGAARPIYLTQPTRLLENRALVARYSLVPSPYLLLGIAPSPLAKAA